MICTPGGCQASTLVTLTADSCFELEAVEGGSKLALVYRLVQRSSGPRPVFQDNSDFEHTILQVTHDWEARNFYPSGHSTC